MDLIPSIADVLRSAEPLVESALCEDLGAGDVTSLAIFPDNPPARAQLVAKEHGVIAGLPVAQMVFSRVDPAIEFRTGTADGNPCFPGDVLADIEGPVLGLLAAERISLNFLQHLSGIASHTARFVEALEGTRGKILDTRKTLPGYRVLEKYAVRMGGGCNHRMGLYDMALIKDNHIRAAGSITEAIQRVRECAAEVPVEVEVTSLSELAEALSLCVDRILLDNMTPESMREAVKMTAGRVPLEASGGVRLETVAGIAATGVDFISIGALTHSAPALDISMEILEKQA